jgi:hypothetical protein
MLVQAVGAVGAAVAHATDVLSEGATRGLLALLVLLVAGIVTVALTVDLPAARDQLDAFVADLPAFSEALDHDAIDAIADLQAIRSARTNIARSRTSIVVAGILIAGGILVTAVVV